MTRKDFLLTGFGGLAGILMSLGLTKCSSNSSTPTGPTQPTDKTFTSSSNNGHTHTFTVQKTSVQTPPAAGISGDTSSSCGHTHTFAMTQAQLQSVMNGGSVDITTGVSSVGGDHTHGFTITKWF